MKKILLMAATAAMMFTSCTKSENAGTGVEPGMARLIVKIAGVKSAAGTRAVTAPGATGNLKLNDGYIFVVDGSDKISYVEAISGLTPGLTHEQELTSLVASDSRVYILGNIPSDITPANFAVGDPFSEIEAAVSAIANNTDYTDAALANSNGAPKAITLSTTDEGEASVAIDLSPLYSRMELVKMVGGDYITSFTVKGVYVDDYFDSFKMTGAEAGSQHQQEQGTDFSGVMGDNAGWDSALDGSDVIAAPTTGSVWAYHMASAALPRFIIHLGNIKYDTDGAGAEPEVTISGDRYITVSGYDEEASGLISFERGKIYRIGADDGITFELDELGLTPNPENVTLTVNVQVIDWVVEPLTPEL